ncbi:hypothetical protein HGRIS_010701 [Hohenbuehelia grisea]|uniref:Glycosyl hydrolase family 13 catalytic domain-containing protein n=1 Tax=Hohenbuehelia grisea TaxID=104357 RepID=A0ABR3IXR1_9AGAR
MTSVEPPTESTLFKPVRAWWKEAIVYQIYPISFLDSNGDGLGDLNGVLSKLDYISDLGVDVIWLCPIYPSPLMDMGYDISDYCDIDPKYGTLEDWDRLLKGAHDRGMKIMMDLVANHTSDEHEWFRQSRSNKSNPKRDWYVWRAPKIDAAGRRQTPNNWKSVFQGPAWDYDKATEEYYLHLYHPGQPDLNWENVDVRRAIWDVMRFWLERGCDGFRMDVINKISKVPGLPDAPISNPDEEYQQAGMYYVNGPRVHEFVKELNTQVLSHYDAMTVGETPYTDSVDEIAAYVLPQNKELNMVFQFEHMVVDTTLVGESKDPNPFLVRKWELPEFKDIIFRWQLLKREDGFWNTIFFENHDHARSVSRFGNDSDEWRAYSAKMLAVLQVTLSGTLYVYQGQELGLRNFSRSWGIEEYKDYASLNYWKKVFDHRKTREEREDVDMSDVLDGLSKKARDHARTPMQWDGTPNGGFTTGKPWMRPNDDHASWNAANQVDDPQSVLSFWKRVLKIRKAHEVLVRMPRSDIVPSLAKTQKLGAC